MPIELRPSGFREWHDHLDGVPSLGIESARLQECLEYYHTHGFRGLFGNPTFGFQQDNLDFLSEAANATWLWLWDVTLTNIDAIYGLRELQYVGIHPKRPGIDFSRFPALRSVLHHWVPADEGLEHAPITTYHLWHYKPRSKVFNGLEIPLGVKCLHFYWANPSSLAGMPVLEQLEELHFHRCRNLADLSQLPRIAPRLRRLLTTTSSRIDAGSGVQDHPTLISALVDGREQIARGAS